MNMKESEAAVAAARILGHKAFVVLASTNSNGQSNYAVRFEREDYSVCFVSDSAEKVLIYAINNQPQKEQNSTQPCRPLTPTTST